MRRIACVLAIALLGACTVDVAVAPSDDSGESDLKATEAGFAARSSALSEPGIKLNSPDLATIPVGGALTANVPVDFDVENFTGTDAVKCRRDGLVEHVFPSPDAPFSYTFPDVPRGMHDLSCALASGGVTVERATRRVYVSGDCDSGNCDDNNPCTNDPCINGQCAYAPLPNCCLSADACPQTHACVQLEGTGPKVCSPCSDGATCSDGAPGTTDSCDLTGAAGAYGFCAHEGAWLSPRPLRGCASFASGLAGFSGPAPYFSHELADLNGSVPPGLVRFQSGPADNGTYCLRSPELAVPSGTNTWTAQFRRKLASGGPATLSVASVLSNNGQWTATTPAQWQTQLATGGDQAEMVTVPLGALPAGSTIRLDLCITVTGAVVLELDDVCTAVGSAPAIDCGGVVHMAAGGKKTDAVHGMFALAGSAGYPLQFSRVTGPAWLNFYPALFDGHLGQWHASADLRQMTNEQTGYHAVSIRASDGVLQAQCSATADIRHPSGLLIWAPGAPDHAFQPLRDAAAALGMAWLDTPDLANVGDLSAFQTLVAVLGTGLAPYTPTDPEVLRLAAFFGPSGRAAIAANDFWSAEFPEGNSALPALRGAFAASGTASPGQPAIDTTAMGFGLHLDTLQVPAAPQGYATKQGEILWANSDQLGVASGAAGCVRVLRVQPATGPASWTEVACEHVGGNRTVALSAPFGAFTALPGHASPVEHAKRILLFLANGNPPCASDAECNDNDACTVNACIDAKCTFATPVNCSDANACTVDSCATDSGCAHIADPNATCDDGAFCTGNDHCENGSCVVSPSAPCDDTDGNLCTTAQCQPWVGCVHTNNVAPCNDGNPCTANDQCENGICAGANQAPVLGDYCTAEPLGALPPDPKTLAPPLPTTTVTSFAAAIGFLWSGANAIQKPLPNAAPLSFDPKVVAVARGKVMQRVGINVAPLPKTKVWVPAHPEWGYVLTRLDGSFDFVAEQGEAIVVEFVKPGFFPVHRKVDLPRRDYVAVPHVVLVQPDAASGLVQFPAPPNVMSVVVSSVTQGAPGSAYVDDAPRQTMLFVPPGTTASVHANGQLTLPPQLTLRVTEYTVGPDGPAAMPANLPPASGYTWCGEFSADEVMAAGPTAWVEFSRPLSVYLDNFLGLDVGLTVPVGYYDRAAGAWKQPRPKAIGDGPEFEKYLRNALVIAAGIHQDELKIWLTQPSGLSSPGLPTELLDAMGFTEAERLALKVRLQMTPGGAPSVPKSFWRFQIDHMTPWDANLGFAYIPEGQTEDPPAKVGPVDPPRNPNQKCGSIIHCESQGLAEEFPVVGTSLALRYESQRTPGGAQNAVVVPPPPTGATKPASAATTVAVAGQTVAVSSETENGGAVYRWDGKDAFGRAVNGFQEAVATTAYAYNNKRVSVPVETGGSGISISWGQIAAALGCNCPATATTTLACQYPDGSICLAKTENGSVATFVKLPPPLFGTQTATVKGLSTTDVAVENYSPRLAQREISRTARKRVGSISAAADFGGLSIGVHHAYDPGTQTLVLGTGQLRHLPSTKLAVTSHMGGGTLALSAVGVNQAQAIGTIDFADPIDAFVSAPKGFVHIASLGVLYEVAPDGMVTFRCGPTSENQGVEALALASPNTLLVATHHEGKGTVALLQVGQPGCVKTTVAGSLTADIDGDWRGPATAAHVMPTAVAAAPDGAVFIAEGTNATRRVRRIDANGVIAPYFGSGADIGGVAGCDDVNQSATKVCIGRPSAISVDAEGNLFVGTDAGRLYRVAATDGKVQRLDLALAATVPNWAVAAVHATGVNAFGYCQNTGGPLTWRGTSMLAQTSPATAGIFRLLGAGDDSIGNAEVQQANLAGGSAGDLTVADCTAMARGTNGAWLIAAQVDAVSHPRRILKVTPQGQVWSGETLFVPSEDGSEVYKFTADGRHEATADATTGANLWAFTYEPATGKLATIADADGQITTVSRDQAGHVIELARAGLPGTTTKVALNASGLASKVVNPAGESTTLVYATTADKHGLLAKLIHPSGDVSTFEWDSRGRLAKDTNAAGQYKSLATQDTIADSKSVTTVTTNLGRTTIYETNHFADGSSHQKMTTATGSARIDRDLPTSGSIAANGEAAQSAVAGSHRANKFRLEPDGTATWLRYGADKQWGAEGRLPEEAWVAVPPISDPTTYGPALLAHQRREEKVAPPGIPAPLASREVTDWVTVADNGGPAVELASQQKAELLQGFWKVTSTSAAYRVMTTYFDAKHRPERTVIAGLPETETQYDEAGRVKVEIVKAADDPLKQRKLTYTYANGRLSKVAAKGTDEGGGPDTAVSVDIGTDAAWRVSSQTFSDTSTIKLARDQAGRLTGVTMPKSSLAAAAPAYGFAYGKADQPKAEALPEAPPMAAWLTQFEYDEDGDLKKSTRPDGKSILLTRNQGTGRLESISAPDDALNANLSVDVSPTYDAQGRVSKVAHGKYGSLGFAWRGALNGRETWLPQAGTDPLGSNGAVAGWSVLRDYDSVFRVRRVGVSKPGPMTLASYHWLHTVVDDDGMLAGLQLLDGDRANPVSLGSYTRDAGNGLLKYRTLGPGTAKHTPNGFAEAKAYEVYTLAAVLYREDYDTRDGLGRLTQRKVTYPGVEDTWTYTYDSHRGWLKSAHKNGALVGAWQYDARGNRVSETVAGGVTIASTFDLQDKQLTAGTRTLTYGDDLGRVTSESEQNGASRSYTWDAGGRLVKAVLKPATGPEKVVDYVLDAAGRRVGKKLNGALQVGWLYDGALRPTPQVDAEGKLELRFAYGSLGHSPDVAVKFNTTDGTVAGVYWFVHDQVGSVVAVVDTATGTAVERTKYGPWGERQPELETPGFKHPFGFAGGLHDTDTKLVRFGAREYDPRIGRWLARDPIGLVGGANSYSYAASDPVNAFDASGEIAVPAFAAGLAMLALRNAAKAAAMEIAQQAMRNAACDGDVSDIDWVDVGIAAISGAVGGGPRLGPKFGMANGTSGGPRAFKDFTKKGKKEIWDNNTTGHSGQPTCEGCGVQVIQPSQSKKGVSPPGHEGNADHVIPKSKGGDGAPSNGQVLCRDCNLSKVAK